MSGTIGLRPVKLISLNSARNSDHFTFFTSFSSVYGSKDMIFNHQFILFIVTTIIRVYILIYFILFQTMTKHDFCKGSCSKGFLGSEESQLQVLTESPFTEINVTQGCCLKPTCGNAILHLAMLLTGFLDFFAVVTFLEIH